MRMDVERLKEIMKAENKRVIDIASELQMAPDTVRKFLRGESVSRVVEAAFRRYIEDRTLKLAAAKAASG